MIYVMSDIHGEYDKFIEMLKKINFSDSDTLYILGDIFDRGPHPIKIILKIMTMPNVICIVGNHELMGMRCLPFLMGEITDESIAKLDKNERYYHRTDAQLVQFAGWKPEFEKN